LKEGDVNGNRDARKDTRKSSNPADPRDDGRNSLNDQIEQNVPVGAGCAHQCDAVGAGDSAQQ